MRRFRGQSQVSDRLRGLSAREAIRRPTPARQARSQLPRNGRGKAPTGLWPAGRETYHSRLSRTSSLFLHAVIYSLFREDTTLHLAKSGIIILDVPTFSAKVCLQGDNQWHPHFQPRTFIARKRHT